MDAKLREKLEQAGELYGGIHARCGRVTAQWFDKSKPSKRSRTFPNAHPSAASMYLTLGYTECSSWEEGANLIEEWTGRRPTRRASHPYSTSTPSPADVERFRVPYAATGLDDSPFRYRQDTTQRREYVEHDGQWIVYARFLTGPIDYEQTYGLKTGHTIHKNRSKDANSYMVGIEEIEVCVAPTKGEATMLARALVDHFTATIDGCSRPIGAGRESVRFPGFISLDQAREIIGKIPWANLAAVA